MATKRLRSWYLVILGAAFLLPSAGQLVRFSLTRDDIWWTPRGTFVSLGESRDRVEVYVRGVLLQDLVDGQRLQLVSGASAAPITGADVGLRLNHWDRMRARKLPAVVMASIVAAGAGLVIVIGARQLARDRRTPRSP
jgi:hypothetical protein